MIIFENNIKIITINKIWIALAYTAIYKKESCVLHKGASLSGKSQVRGRKSVSWWKIWRPVFFSATNTAMMFVSLPENKKYQQEYVVIQFNFGELFRDSHILVTHIPMGTFCDGHIFLFLIAPQKRYTSYSSEKLKVKSNYPVYNAFYVALYFPPVIDYQKNNFWYFTSCCTFNWKNIENFVFRFELKFISILSTFWWDANVPKKSFCFQAGIKRTLSHCLV